MFAALLPLFGSIGGQIAKSLFPSEEDKTRRMEVEQAFQLAMIQNASQIENAAADIVKAEAQSTHWLTANWRPITALIFVGLIVSRWLGYTAEGMTEDEYLEVYAIVKIMIGGYVISRGAEKVMDSYKKKE